MILDFTTTATNRIDIIEKCYKSFSENLLGVEFSKCTLYINVDPVPTPTVQELTNILVMCRKYFGTVVMNCPIKPNYTEAYKWLYENAKTKFIFNLEDDWVMLRKIHIDTLMQYFDGRHKELYSASFRAYPHRYISIPTSPQVLHSRFYKAVGKGLNPLINPEIQLRAHKIPGLVLPNKRSEHGAIVPVDGKLCMYPEQGGNKNVVVADIGREWIEGTRLMKPESKEGFTTWILH